MGEGLFKQIGNFYMKRYQEMACLLYTSNCSFEWAILRIAPAGCFFVPWESVRTELKAMRGTDGSGKGGAACAA